MEFARANPRTGVALAAGRLSSQRLFLGVPMLERVDGVVGKRLRWRRKAMGLTLKDMAMVCDVRFQQIAKYEAGVSQMSAATLWKLARALNVDVSFFFEGLARLPAVTAAANTVDGQGAAAVTAADRR
jgi:DNA-binding XRE family transcriptional regulator